MEEILKRLNERRVREEESSEYENKLNAMRSNPTYKKMDSICTKYGYLLNSAYVEGNNIYIHIRSKSDNRYLPGIYYDYRRFGKLISQFSIETTSYGSLSLEEHKEFLEAVISAHNMVDELSKIDFTKLYVLVDEE